MSGPEGDVAPSRDRTVSRVFFVIWLVWGMALIGMRVARPGLEIGDGLNDGDILHSARWFEEHGYRETCFLPTRETGVPPGGRPLLYNTFPPGVFYVHEVLRLAGLRELWAFRVVSVLWGQAAVWVFFAVARRVSGSAVIGAVAAGLYMFSSPYTNYVGGLWEHLPMLTLLGTLACWVRLEGAAGRARGAWLVAAIACAFLDAWLSVQHALMLGVIIGSRGALLAWRRAKEGDRRAAVRMCVAAVLICAVPLPVLGMRFAHQAIAMGGVAPAAEYFRATMAHRGGFEHERMTRATALRACLTRLGGPPPNASDRHATRGRLGVLTVPNAILAGIIVAGLVRIGAARAGRADYLPVWKGLGWGGLMLLAAFTWPLAMSGHAAMHTFVVLMFMPGALLVLASLVAAGAIALLQERAHGRASVRCMTMSLAGVSLAGLTLAHSRRSELLNAFVPLDRAISADVRLERERFRIMERVGAALGPDEHPIRLTPRWPSNAHYLGRRFYSVRAPAELPFVPGESIVVDMTKGRGASGAGNLVARLGVPAATMEPCGLAVYPPEGARLNPGAVIVRPARSLGHGMTLSEARWNRTVDGGAFNLGVGILGRLRDRDAGQLSVQVIVRAGDGRELWRSTGRNDTRVSRGQLGTLALVEVPLEEGVKAATVEVEVRHAQGEPAAVRIDVP